MAALVRLLGEYLRLRHEDPAGLTWASADLWVCGALATAILTWLAVVLFFLRRHRATVVVAVLTVAVLVVLKIWGVGAGLIH